MDLPRALLDGQCAYNGAIWCGFSADLSEQTLPWWSCSQPCAWRFQADKCRGRIPRTHEVREATCPVISPLVGCLSPTGLTLMMSAGRSPGRFNATAGANLSAEDVARLQGYAAAERRSSAATSSRRMSLLSWRAGGRRRPGGPAAIHLHRAACAPTGRASLPGHATPSEWELEVQSGIRALQPPLSGPDQILSDRRGREAGSRQSLCQRSKTAVPPS